uniref:Apple domain-containing protein n=1 Tax=Alexandrium catenella TaxID=2925 RepID=A0A7S1S034_ALECA
MLCKSSRAPLAAAAVVGCLAALPLSVRAQEFDCDVKWSTWESDWSDLKKDWCCEQKDRGCPFDCADDFSDWESSWAVEKKEWCCENKQLGCTAVGAEAKTYDCQVNYWNRSSWPQEQKDWCCEYQQLGCLLPSAPAEASTEAPSTTNAPAAEERAPGSAVGSSSTPAPAADGNRTGASCFEDRVAWEPLDMPGATPSIAGSADECQLRCASTAGCTHFSYWWIGKNCHIQDAYAVRRTSRLGFTSGPFGCWESLDQDKYVREGLTIVERSRRCEELSTLYEPAMGLSREFTLEDITKTEAVKQCRDYCALTEGCEHYTMTFPDRLCQMAGAGANKVTPYANAVSGTPTCWGGEEHETRAFSDSKEAHTLMMKTSLRHGALATSRPSLAAAATLLLAIAALAWGALAAARCTNGRHQSLPQTAEE